MRCAELGEQLNDQLSREIALESTLAELRDRCSKRGLEPPKEPCKQESPMRCQKSRVQVPGSARFPWPQDDCSSLCLYLVHTLRHYRSFHLSFSIPSLVCFIGMHSRWLKVTRGYGESLCCQVCARGARERDARQGGGAWIVVAAQEGR
jgi:hypothetical protein